MAVKDFEFPDRPFSSLLDAWSAVRDLVYQLKAGAKTFVIKDIPITTLDVIPVKHGLRAPPRSWTATTHGPSLVFRGAPSDEKFIYIQATAISTCDVEITP
jgi:hypothetical protein